MWSKKSSSDYIASGDADSYIYTLADWSSEINPRGEIEKEKNVYADDIYDYDYADDTYDYEETSAPIGAVVFLLILAIIFFACVFGSCYGCFRLYKCFTSDGSA